MISLLLSLVVAGPLPDTEFPNPFLQQARELYQQLDFEKCMQRIKQASAWRGSSVSDLRDIELYGGLCAFNLGQKPEAAERFRLALRIDEDLELPEFVSPKAVRLFLYQKKKLRQPAVAALPDDDLPPDAPARPEPPPKPGEQPAPPPPKVTVTSPTLATGFALPLALGAGGVVLGALGVGLGVNAHSLEAQARAQAFESDYLRLRAAAQGSAIGANVSYALAAALLGGAVVALLLSLKGT